jgi:hypothetical protein
MATSARRTLATGNVLWLLCNRVDPVDTAAFFKGVGVGTGLGEADVRLLLRERLLTAERQKTSRPLPTKLLAAYVIQGWNSYRRGEPRAMFRFKPRGAQPDRFPLIDGYPYPERVLARLGYITD